MNMVEGRAVLTGRGWLATTPPDFQEALFGAASWRSFGPGDVVVNAGTRHCSIYGIARGTVGAVTASGAPDTGLSHILHPGDWTGYIPFISGGLTAASTTARSTVYAVTVTPTALNRLLDDRLDWWRHIATLGLTYGEKGSNIVADLLIRDSRRRCAATLLRIADCRLGMPRAGPHQAHATQAELAEIANLSRTTANLILGGFEQRRLIERHYNRIDLLDTSTLRGIVDGDVEERQFA